MSFSGRDEATYAKVHFSNSNLTFTILEDECPNILRNLISAAGAREPQRLHEVGGRPQAPLPGGRGGGHQPGIEADAAADGEDNQDDPEDTGQERPVQ